MNRLATLLAAVAVTVTAAPAFAQSGAAESRLDTAQRRYDNETALYRQAVEEYRAAIRRDYRPSGSYSDRDYDRRDQRYADDDWSRTYRPSSSSQPRYLTRSDEVYYGNDGQTYCRRSDGTTGLVVGAALGGVFGNLVDGGRRRTLGTLLGGAGGALLGRSVDQQRVTCR